MQEISHQHELNLGAGFWLSIILGLVLLILNAGFYFQAPLAQFMGWSVLDGAGFFSVWLAYLLFCLLGFFIIGLLRGRVTWNASAATRLSVTAGLIGMLPVIAASLVPSMLLQSSQQEQAWPLASSNASRPSWMTK